VIPQHTLRQAVAYECEWYEYTYIEDETYPVSHRLMEKRDGEAGLSRTKQGTVYLDL